MADVTDSMLDGVISGCRVPAPQVSWRNGGCSCVWTGFQTHTPPKLARLLMECTRLELTSVAVSSKLVQPLAIARHASLPS